MVNKGVHVKSLAPIAIASVVFSAANGANTSLFDVISSILEHFGIEIHDNEIELNGYEVNSSQNTSLAKGEDGSNGIAIGGDGGDGGDGIGIGGLPGIGIGGDGGDGGNGGDANTNGGNAANGKDGQDGEDGASISGVFP